jgi:hypothetical protein
LVFAVSRQNSVFVAKPTTNITRAPLTSARRPNALVAVDMAIYRAAR